MHTLAFNTKEVKVIKPTIQQIQAAQEVFEQWFCEDLGLDMDSRESDWIISKMLEAALNAENSSLTHS